MCDYPIVRGSSIAQTDWFVTMVKELILFKTLFSLSQMPTYKSALPIKSVCLEAAHVLCVFAIARSMEVKAASFRKYYVLSLLFINCIVQRVSSFIFDILYMHTIYHEHISTPLLSSYLDPSYSRALLLRAGRGHVATDAVCLW